MNFLSTKNYECENQQQERDETTTKPPSAMVKSS